MNVLLVSDAYPPEVRSAAHVMHELGEELTARGHRVSVLATFPQYNVADPDGGPRGIYRKETFDGIDVHRCYSFPIHNVGPVVRGIGHLQLSAAYALQGLLARRPDAIICYSPPLLLGLSSWFLSRWRRALFVLNVQDLFPQNAIDLGILRNPSLIAAFEGIEKRLYRVAHAITTHSPSNREAVLRRGVPPEKVRVVYNWVDTELHRPGQRENEWRSKFGLGQKFVVLFAGVLGHAQDLEVILQAAALVGDDPEILFLVVGDGAARKHLEREIAVRRLSNVRRENFVRREEYPRLVAACDVGLVTLKAQMRTPVVPSKIQAIMACGRPIAATLNLESDGHQIIGDAACGVSLPAGDSAGLALAVRRLKADPSYRARLERNGRAYALEHFSKRRCVGQYESLLYELGAPHYPRKERQHAASRSLS
jgi:glycosyltransferase involved in cell wall biosynthesis